MRTLALVLLFASGSVLAQPITLDGEFARVLLGVESADDILPGAAPEALLPFLPEGATILGGVQRTADGSSPRAYAWVDATPEAAAQTFSARSFAGWILQPPYEGDTTGGFTTTREPDRSVILFSEETEGRLVFVRFRDRPDGGAYVSVTTGVGYGMRPRGGEDEAVPLDGLRATLPLLEPPSGATQHYEGGGGDSDTYRGRAVLESEEPIAALAAHYSTQMSAGGWTAIGAEVADTHATSAWAKEMDGEPLAAVFQLSRAGEGGDRLSIMVSRGR